MYFNSYIVSFAIVLMYPSLIKGEVYTDNTTSLNGITKYIMGATLYGGG